jgi:hypothetical protein
MNPITNTDPFCLHLSRDSILISVAFLILGPANLQRDFLTPVTFLSYLTKQKQTSNLTTVSVRRIHPILSFTITLNMFLGGRMKYFMAFGLCPSAQFLREASTDPKMP